MEIRDFSPWACAACGKAIISGGTFADDGASGVFEAVHESCRRTDPERWARAITTVNVSLR